METKEIIIVFGIVVVLLLLGILASVNPSVREAWEDFESGMEAVEKAKEPEPYFYLHSLDLIKNESLGKYQLRLDVESSAKPYYYHDHVLYDPEGNLFYVYFVERKSGFLNRDRWKITATLDEELEDFKDGPYFLTYNEWMVVILMQDGRIKEVITDERTYAYLMITDFDRMEVKEFLSYSEKLPELCINCYYYKHMKHTPDYSVCSQLINPNGEIRPSQDAECTSVWMTSYTYITHTQVCLKGEELNAEGTYTLIQYTKDVNLRPRIVIEIPLHNQKVGEVTVHEEW